MIKANQVIQQLLAICRDGAAGYEQAAQLAANTAYTQFFYKQRDRRLDFIRQLAHKLTGDAQPDIQQSTPLAKVHRKWVDVRWRVTNQRVGSVLSECKRGDEIALLLYQRALRNELPSTLKTLIERQQRSIEQVLLRISTLEQATAPMLQLSN